MAFRHLRLVTCSPGLSMLSAALVFADDLASAYTNADRSVYERIKEEYSHKIKIETLEIVPLRIFCGMEISPGLSVTCGYLDAVDGKVRKHSKEATRALEVSSL